MTGAKKLENTVRFDDKTFSPMSKGSENSVQSPSLLSEKKKEKDERTKKKEEEVKKMQRRLKM